MMSCTGDLFKMETFDTNIQYLFDIPSTWKNNNSSLNTTYHISFEKGLDC